MSMSHPGAEGILQREVLTRLDVAGKGGMEEGELHGTVDGTPEEIAEALARLERDGRAVEMEGRWYAPGQTGWATGVVELLDEGDALIRPGPRRDPSFYIRRRNLKRAVEGDTVVVRRLGKDRPWDDRPQEGMAVIDAPGRATRRVALRVPPFEVLIGEELEFLTNDHAFLAALAAATGGGG